MGAGASIATVLLNGVSWAAPKASQTMKVGFILPEQGPLADGAKSLLWGFECFLKEKKFSPLTILKKDSGPDGEKTLEALADLLMSKGAPFLIGPPSLEGAEKAIQGLANAGAILFVTNPSVRLVAGDMCLPSVFRMRPNSYQCAQPLAPWAVQNLGLKVFLTGSDDTEGNEKADFFAYGFEKAGGQFVDRIMTSTSDHGGLKRVLEAVSSSDASFVFASYSRKTAGTFLKAAAPSLKQAIIGPESLTMFPATLAGAGSAATGVKTLTFLKSPVEFAAKVKKQTGHEPTDVAAAAEGYDIAQAICRVTEHDSAKRGDPGEVIKFLESMEIEGARGKISFDKNHEPVMEAMVREWGLSGKKPSQKIIAELGPTRSPDFGCGRVGYPRRPEREAAEEEAGQDAPPKP